MVTYPCCKREIYIIDKELSIIEFKIDLAGKAEVSYNCVGKDWLAVKERSRKMASPKTVSASLQDDKGTWVVRGRVYDPETGTIRQRTKSTKLKVKDSTKRKAELIMRDIISEWTKEANSISIENSPPLSVYTRKFIERRKGLGREEDTITSYEDYNRLHITPKLGSIPIQKITLKDIEEFYSWFLDDHKVNSAKRVHVVLAGAFDEAVREGIIQNNIARYYEFPTAEKYNEAKTYCKEDVESLLKQAKAEGEPIYSAVVLAVCYGLRRSEVCGLRWSDIDFNENILVVSNTVVQCNGIPIEKEKTKTTKSHRVISLLPDTIPYFKALKKKQEDSGLILGKVCVWPNGEAVRPDFVGKKTKQLMKKCGLSEIRFHDLRHTAASLLAPHVTPKQLQEFLGHEDISTTLEIYTHVNDEQRKETSNAMNQIISGGFVLKDCSEENAESSE